MTKAAKAKYDRAYRKKNYVAMQAKKAAYFLRTYDPAKAAIDRKKRAPQHAEYCRQPEYRKWKRKYDMKYRASAYGPFAEAYEILKELQREIRRQMPDRFERYAQSGRKQWNPLNQLKRRNRENGRNETFGGEFERSLVVNFAAG